MAIETPPIKRDLRGIPAEVLPQVKPAQTPETERPMTTRGVLGKTAENPTFPRRTLQQEPNAFERYQKNLKKRLAVGVLALAGVATALGGYAAINSSPKPENSPSPSIPAATETVSSAPGTPRVEISPNHFPLNPKTVKESAIFLTPTNLPGNQDFPNTFSMDFHAFTIQDNIKVNPDKSVTITLDTNGGPLLRSDTGLSVINYGGGKQELYTYECDTNLSSTTTEPNNSFTVTILPQVALMDSHGGRIGTTGGTGLLEYLKAGDASVDYTIGLNGNNASNTIGFSRLNSAVGQSTQGISFVTNQLVLTNK